MIMNMKGKLALGFMSVCVGAFALSLTSCKNSREIPVNEEQMHEVVTESYYLEEDGSLSPFDLKAAESEKGSIEGARSYYHNEEAKITATAKGGYKLYSFYVKDNKVQKYTEALGPTNNGDGKSHTISFNVLQDVTVVAVFSSFDGAALGYKDLKIDGAPSDKTITVDGDKTSSSASAVGVQLQGVMAEGKIVKWVVKDGNFKAWDIKEKSANWLNASVSNGNISLSFGEHKSKTEGARTATFKVGKDGTKGGQSTWRTVTITQNSYYNGAESNPTTPDSYEYQDGTKVVLPEAINLVFRPQGEAIDLKTKDRAYKETVYAVYNIYKNGNVVSAKKVPLDKVFGNVESWLNRNDTTFSATKNDTRSTRKDYTNVTWRANGHVVKTTKINFSQDAVKYNVIGEVH